MAFKASNNVPAHALDQAKTVAWSARRQAQTFSTMFEAVTDRDQIVRCWREMSIHSAQLDALKTTPGIGQYAKDQENDQGYDVAAEFTALVAAIDAVVTEIVTIFPKDGADFLLIQKFGANGTLTMGTVPAASLATLRGLLDTVAATVS